MSEERPVRHYDDIEPGWEQEAGPFQVEREEVIAFATRWDPQPWHLDDAAAEASVFGGLTACAAHTTAIQSRLTHDLPERLAIVAGLGNDEMRLEAPVRPGDALMLHVRVQEKRRSASNPARGIVALRYWLTNQTGETAMSTLGKVMVSVRNPG